MTLPDEKKTKLVQVWVMVDEDFNTSVYSSEEQLEEAKRDIVECYGAESWEEVDNIYIDVTYLTIEINEDN